MGRAACLLTERAGLHPSPPAHVPLDDAILSFDGLVPPWHHAHVTHAVAVSLVDWHERVHPVVALQLLEVQSAETPSANRSLANHPNASTGRSKCRRH